MRPGRGRSPGRGTGADRRLDFLIAGVQKGGTTSLYRMLAQHRQIAAARKELHYFSDEKRDWSSPNYRSYHRRIRWSESATVAGESTPSYVFWPGAMERIKAYNPDIRLVLSFRDPVERAFSQWCMERERRDDIPGFGEAIRAVSPRRWPRSPAEAGHPTRAFVGRGYYGEQLIHVLGLFPAEHVLLLDFHQMFTELPASLNRVTDLIGVERFGDVPRQLRERARPLAIDAEPPREEDVSLLVDRYASDLAVFERLSGLGVAAWPTARVLAGSLAPADLARALAGTTTFSGARGGDSADRTDRS